MTRKAEIKEIQNWLLKSYSEYIKLRLIVYATWLWLIWDAYFYFCLWQKIKDRFHTDLEALHHNFSLKVISTVFR